MQTEHGDEDGIKYGPLKLVILKGEGVNLLGRNWINQIRIDWRCVTKPEGTGVHKTECDIEDTKIDREVQNLIGKYPKIFEDRVGRMKGYQAKINLKKGAVPKYCKARSVPFAVQEAVTNELDRLEKEGVIESIPYSEWASPIVVVPKPDGGIRICADFKRTLNPHIENEEYHIPSPDEVFAKVQGFFLRKLI